MPEELEIEKDVLLEVPVEETEIKPPVKIDIAAWRPKTSLGLKVKNGEIKNIDEILENGLPILEPEIVDVLLPEASEDFIFLGQAKGKFGGGARRIFKQTQKKTPEGNKPSFACLAVVGDRKGHVGLGYGKSNDTLPARDKAIRKAKLNLIKIKLGCGSWECKCSDPHSIPYKVEAKSGSVLIYLIPAPKGKGLVCDEELKKVLKLAGIKDIWIQSFGQTKRKLNFVSACFNALKKLK